MLTFSAIATRFFASVISDRPCKHCRTVHPKLTKESNKTTAIATKTKGLINATSSIHWWSIALTVDARAERAKLPKVNLLNDASVYCTL